MPSMNTCEISIVDLQLRLEATQNFLNILAFQKLRMPDCFSLRATIVPTPPGQPCHNSLIAFEAWHDIYIV